MNEGSFIQAIHRGLPSAIYRWKINDPRARGVADAYYSGEGGDLWVEYKFVQRLPKKNESKIRTCLTEKQIHWLNARRQEGRDVALIIGCKFGCIFVKDIPYNLPVNISRADFLALTTKGDPVKLARAFIEAATLPKGVAQPCLTSSPTG